MRFFEAVVKRVTGEKSSALRSHLEAESYEWLTAYPGEFSPKKDSTGWDKYDDDNWGW